MNWIFFIDDLIQLSLDEVSLILNNSVNREANTSASWLSSRLWLISSLPALIAAPRSEWQHLRHLSVMRTRSTSLHDRYVSRKVLPEPKRYAEGKHLFTAFFTKLKASCLFLFSNAVADIRFKSWSISRSKYSWQSVRIWKDLGKNEPGVASPFRQSFSPLLLPTSTWNLIRKIFAVSGRCYIWAPLRIYAAYCWSRQAEVAAEDYGSHPNSLSRVRWNTSGAISHGVMWCQPA